MGVGGNGAAGSVDLARKPGPRHVYPTAHSRHPNASRVLVGVGGIGAAGSVDLARQPFDDRDDAR